MTMKFIQIVNVNDIEAYSTKETHNLPHFY